ncbi:MAG: circadian clock KaiB family protein [Rhodospirillaceae bacterium]
MADPRLSTETGPGVILKLFVTGRTPSAMRARSALQKLIETQNRADLHLQVIDVLADPQAAVVDNVFATPTLIKIGEGEERRLIGDLSSVEKVEVGLLLGMVS